MDYIEREILADYVGRFYGRFLTRGEGKVWLEVEARRNDAAGMANKGLIIRRMQKLSGDPDVEAAIAEGLDHFQDRTVQRILREHAAEVVINRCGRCGKIVATPKAQQCLWCGFDWHPGNQASAP